MATFAVPPETAATTLARAIYGTASEWSQHPEVRALAVMTDDLFQIVIAAVAPVRVL